MGPRFTYAQVASSEIVDRAQLDHGSWRKILADSWGAQVFIFAGALTDGAELYGRMFAPAWHPRGSRNRGRGSGDRRHSSPYRRCGSSGKVRLDIVQGVAMGRPSFLSASAELEDGAVSAIEVGGACAFIAEGKIEVPDHLLEQDWRRDETLPSSCQTAAVDATD